MSEERRKHGEMEVEANGEMDGNQYVFFLPTTNDLLIGVDSTNKYRIKFPIEHPNPLINIAKPNTNVKFMWLVGGL